MKIFLSGGGNEKDSARLDREFASSLKAGGSLVYVPVAMDEGRHIKCLEWFKSVFEPLWHGEIRMLSDLGKRKGLADVGGIYIGGGDTARLMDATLSTNFGSYLREAIAHGIPIYGGSAGAIVLGKTTETAPKTKQENIELAGLNMLHGYSVVCHHNSTDYADTERLACELNQPLIVLSEQSGALLEDNVIISIGTKPVVLVTKTGEVTEVKPGERKVL